MKHFGKKIRGAWWVCYGTPTAYQNLYRIFDGSVRKEYVDRAIKRRHGSQ